MSHAIPPDLTEALRTARAICVLTGAGVSTESGIPSFRDAQSGFWANYDQRKLATPEGFVADPALVTRWYDERRVQCLTLAPNAGHHALAELERQVIARGGTFTLATQNIDGLHHRAGSHNILELHGSITRWFCIRCHAITEEFGAQLSGMPPLREHVVREQVVGENSSGEPPTVYPPRCTCGGMRRPSVVWFGEVLPEDVIDAAQRAAKTCDLFLTLGTSAQVYPAAGLIEIAATNGHAGRGARILEINPEPTPLSSLATWSLRGKTGELLPPLIH